MLQEIVDYKYEEVARRKAETPQAELEQAVRDLPPPRNFPAAIRGRWDIRIIAEMKRCSPSHPEPFTDLYDPRIIAQEYAGNGAAAISVLTDERYFGGQCFDLRRARRYMPLPLLRKDFIIDIYQIYEARYWLADAVLLIVAILEQPLLVDLLAVTRELGMAALVECHTAHEIDRALEAGADIIGINNRNLATLEVDISVTERLAPLVPLDCALVTESGLKTREDLERLAEAGIDAALIGTALMESADPGLALRRFVRVPQKREARATR
ncbi:MAG: indole-3-glycerol phosphate synthase TrpC [Armatimonadetes bacterium]|nr:indole-3-glycerol phosphate synthase TrpC [Armatimonadota bacterium]